MSNRSRRRNSSAWLLGFSLFVSGFSWVFSLVDYYSHDDRAATHHAFLACFVLLWALAFERLP